MRSALFLIKKELFYTTMSYHTFVWALLSFLSTLLGVFFLIVVISVINGMQSHFKGVLKGELPDLTILYHPHTTASPLNQSNFIRSIENIKTSFTLVQTDAVCLNQTKQIIPLKVHAIFDEHARPILEQSIITSPNTQRQSPLPQNTKEALIAQNIAQQNGWKVGDFITLLFPNLESHTEKENKLSIVEWEMEIVGLYQSRNQHIPYLWTRIQPKYLKEFNYPIEYINSVYIEDDNLFSQTMSRVNDIVSSQDTMVPWFQWHHDIHSAFKLEKLVSTLLLIIMFIIVMYNISSTLMLNFMEKKKDIALYKSLGCSQTNILLTFIFKGILLGGTGTIAGATLGLIACYLMNQYHIIPIPESVYHINHLPTLVYTHEVLIILLSSFIICLLFSLYPSYQASKLNIIETLRRE